VASALATAHRHNIIHRDLKPHNIMLATGIDGSEQAKLVDFGIAKTFDESTQLTSMGSALGTPYYMSPEQIEGATVDARSDIYALGIILYEMLVGEVPFADQSTPAVLVRQLKERPARPSLKNPAVPPSLEAIALRCLEKDPAQRFQSADEFAAALNDATAAMNEVAGMSTMPMMRATPSAPAADQSEPDRKDRDLTPPAAAAPTLVIPVAPGTKPTVAVPLMQPAVASPSSEAAPPRKSSMAPLVAVAAVLLLLAGGYLWWSGRQAPVSTTASSAPAEAPKAVPAMAGQEPVATADAAKANAAAPSAGAPAPSSATPPAPPATAVKAPAATAAAANATRAAARSSAAAPVAAPPARESVGQPAAAPAPTPTIPENAAVLFRCSGAPDVCASLRSTVNEALDKAGFRTVTSVDRADIAVGAVAAPLQDKVSQQFGQTFLTRTYSIEFSGEAPKLGDAVSMPPSTTVSFDASVGRERLEEKSRLVAGDIIDRLRAFVKKKRAS
jgi:serine/threonine-protein kinase